MMKVMNSVFSFSECPACGKPLKKHKDPELFECLEHLFYELARTEAALKIMAREITNRSPDFYKNLNGGDEG